MKCRPDGPSEDSTKPNPDQNHTQQMTSVNNNTKLNKSTSELREQGNRRKRRRRRRRGGGSGVTFVAMQRFHKFISPSNWLMKHTCGEEQREQPKGKKNVSGGKKTRVGSCLSAACASNVLCRSAPTFRFTGASCRVGDFQKTCREEKL